MGTKRPKPENEFVAANLAAELTELRLNSSYFNRFIAYASAQLKCESRLLVGRLRMVFLGRTPPTAVALLLKSFFETGAHLDLIHECQGNIRLYAPKALMGELKRFIFGLKNLHRISHAILLTEDIPTGVHLFVHDPDQFGDRKTKNEIRKSGASGTLINYTNKFWDTLLMSWPERTDIKLPKNESFASNYDTFPLLIKSATEGPNPLEISVETERDNSDRLWALNKITDVLDLLFKDQKTSVQDLFYETQSAIKHPPDVFNEKDFLPNYPLSLTQHPLQSWELAWNGVLTGDAAKTANIYKEKLKGDLKGLKRHYAKAKPYLTEATINELDLDLETRMIAAGHKLETTWPAFFAEHQEAFRQACITFYNTHRTAVKQAREKEREKPKLAHAAVTMSESEVVEFLEKAGLQHDLLAYQCIADLVKNPSRVPNAKKENGEPDGINIAGLVASALPKEEAKSISTPYGYHYGDALAVALESRFDVSYQGDPKERSSSVLVKTKNSNDEFVKFQIRNRTVDYHREAVLHQLRAINAIRKKKKRK